jgi:hypothetical protein
MRKARSLSGGGCIVAFLATTATIQAAHANGKYVFDIYGFAQADFIGDSSRLDPLWEDAFRPSKIAVPRGQFGSDGQATGSVKQSRLGVSGTLPISEQLDDLKFKFEFDLFGTGSNAGQTTFRLRHVYGEWGMLLAGQTNSLFMDIDVFPNVIDYWGPDGMVFLRTPQIRLTPWRTSYGHFSIAIERATNDVDPGQLREIDPDLGNNIQNDEKLPDLTLQYYRNGTWGHAQLAAIVRRVGYDTLNTVDNRPKGAATGWGVNLSGHLNLLERDKLLGQVVYGEGIASYMNDGGVDLSAEDTIVNGIRPRAVPLFGIEAYYDHYWTDALSSSIGYSSTRVTNTNLQDLAAFRWGQYASANLLYTPSPKILLGAELLWGDRKNRDGEKADDFRLQISVKYSFGTAIKV